MKISPTMDLYILMERMGEVATLADAEAFRHVLNERGYTGQDTGEISEDDWLAMMGDACGRST